MYARFRTLALFLAACSAVSLPAFGAVVGETGPFIGAPGLPGAGNYNVDDNQYDGNSGADAFVANGGVGDSYVFTVATATGGVGGDTTGSDPSQIYNGGNGGSGVSIVGGGPSPLVTINSGTYLGGVGGTAQGVGSNLNGGYGGSAVNINGASALINGGTFIGGSSGLASGAGSLGSGFAGSGLNANDNSLTTITGGDFIGGEGVLGGGAGAGVVGLGGVVNIHGGTFTGGVGTFGPFGIDNYTGIITLYGTDFSVDGNPVGSGPLTGSGVLTGLLEDNASPTSTAFIDRAFGGSINLVVVPEPTCLALLTLTPLLTRRRRFSAIG